MSSWPPGSEAGRRPAASLLARRSREVLVSPSMRFHMRFIVNRILTVWAIGFLLGSQCAWAMSSPQVAHWLSEGMIPPTPGEVLQFFITIDRISLWLAVIILAVA